MFWVCSNKKLFWISGAIEGIKFYIEPDLSKLSDIKIWEAAAVQIFFSLSVAGGGLITLASYNPFKNNVIRYGIVYYNS